MRFLMWDKVFTLYSFEVQIYRTSAGRITKNYSVGYFANLETNYVDIQAFADPAWTIFLSEV